MTLPNVHLRHLVGEGGGGGTVPLLNRQPAHLNDTGNLKQTLGSPSQKIVFFVASFYD